MKPHAVHPAAENEYAEAAEYYSRLDPQLGRRFHDAIEGLILDIRREPQRFPLFDQSIRRHFSEVFPYAVLYVDQTDRALIIAVMHMKRRPGYWKHRLD